MKTQVDRNHLCNLTLLGNLVTTPTIRYQANPVLAIAEIVVATHTRWKDKNTQQYKEWTNFHTVKVIGDIVERSLIHAQKGDVVLIQGYLINTKKSERQIVHATYAQTYAKGFAKSVNQIHCSGQITAPIKTMVTEHNKTFTEVTLTVNHYVYSPITHKERNISIERTIHIWGAQGQTLSDNANEGDHLVVDGKLNYANNNTKDQIIDAHQAVLLKTP